MRKTGKFTKKGTNEVKKEVSDEADGVEAGNDVEQPEKNFGGSEEESSTAEDKSADAEKEEDNKKSTKKESNGKKRKMDDSSKHESEADSDDNDEPLSKRSKRGGKKSKAALKAGKKASRAAGKKAATPEKDEEYEVEKVIDMKESKGKRKFLIRWKGYKASSDTWEDEKGLSCAEAIKVFLASAPASKKAKAGAGDKAKKSKEAAPAADENGAETTKEYEVESILEVYHKKNGTDEFLVRWKGYGKSEDTWEPEAHLSCPELIAKFKAKLAKAKAATPRELRAVPPHTDRFTLSMGGSGRRLSRRKPGKQRTSYHEQE